MIPILDFISLLLACVKYDCWHSASEYMNRVLRVLKEGFELS
jgi:hypothetical protein